MAFLIFDRFTLLYGFSLMSTSLGRVFGVSKPLVGHVSLFGRQRGIGSWRVIIFTREATLYLVGVGCVALMVRLLITYFYIVLWWLFYGVGVSRLLGSNGSYL